MDGRILIKNARVVNPNEDEFMSDILIDGWTIADVAPWIDEGAGDRVIDAAGACVSPGLIDLHVHTRDPGYTYKEDLLSAAEAAAAGGVTGFAAMPNTDPVCDNVKTLEYILEKAAHAKARVFPIAAITVGEKGERTVDFERLVRSGAAAFSDDGVPVRTAALMAQAMVECHRLGVPVFAHCEDRSLSTGGIINEGEVSRQLNVKGIPAAAEDVGTARELALARSLRRPVHICHVSTRSSIEMIANAKRDGVKVTAETCPHYFIFDERELLVRNADFRMNPPLRTQEDVLAVRDALRTGVIDAIATDHAPHSPEEKANFLTAPNGVIGMELSLAAGITFLVNKGILSLPRLIALMSENPARILHHTPGEVKRGCPADLVIYDPRVHFTVDREKLHGKSKNTPFHGMDLCGKVRYTFLNGEIVFEDQEES